MGTTERPLVAAVAAQADLHNRIARAMIAAVLPAPGGGVEALQTLQRDAEPVAHARQEEIRELVDRDQPWSDEDLRALVRALASFSSWSFGGLDHIPVESIAKLIRRSVTGQVPSPELRRALLVLGRLRLEQRGPAESRRAAMILTELGGERPDLAIGSNGGIDGDDDWGEAAIAALAERGGVPAGWVGLLEHAATATASKPAKRWLTGARELIDALGEDDFHDLARTLLGALDAPASSEMRRGSGVGAFAGLNHLPKAVPTERNAVVLRGIVWSCSIPGGPSYAELVAGVARACAKKIPDVGARSPKVLNACLWTLAQMGEDGAPHLVELSQKARKPSVRGRIDKALDSAAGSAGLSREALEVRAVQDASPLVQRRYFEQALASGAEWPWGRFREHVLGHPGLVAVAEPLIFVPDGGEPFLARDNANGAADAADGVARLSDDVPVRLWHPAGLAVADVLAWRERLERERVIQPFKQAHREVYLLTPVEQEAGTASARFAGHFVRQHTLRALCDARGWNYRLQGPFDPGGNPNAMLRLPRIGLVAELEVEAVEEDAPASGHGIFLYAQTGTLSFYRERTPGPPAGGARVPRKFAGHAWLTDRKPIPLSEIPPLTFSEVLRDVDLFVSVAGVAADPEFPLNAPDPWIETWHEQAFDELTPIGAGRRELLERILPSLPIADRAAIDGRFLVVRGRLNRYRIHLGSANVLIEPGSRHLCIVAAGGGRRPGEPGYVWLPFEGDDTLSVILSKAMMLAADDTIKDAAIRAQIERR